MEDDSMLGDLETGSGFLEELASGRDNVDNDLVSHQPSMQSISMINDAQQQQQQFSTSVNISGNPYGGMGMQQQNSSQLPQQQYQNTNFAQYSSAPKVHHIGANSNTNAMISNQGMSMMSNQPGMIGNQSLMTSESSSHRVQQHFGNPPPNGSTSVHQGQTLYNTYNISGAGNTGGSHMPAQQQQQQSPWNQSPPGGTVQTAMYQQQQSNSALGATSQMSTPFVAHHDYAVSSGHQVQIVDPFQNNPRPVAPKQQTIFIQRISSPNQMKNVAVSGLNSSNTITSIGHQQIPGRPVVQSYQSGNQTNICITPVQNQQTQQGFSGNTFQQAQNANLLNNNSNSNNSNAMNNQGQFQQFSYGTTNMQTSPQQSLGNVVQPIGNFQQISPVKNSNPGLGQYQTLNQQQPSIPSLSQCSTPSSQTFATSSTQGNFAHSNVQVNKLVSPAQGMSSANSAGLPQVAQPMVSNNSYTNALGNLNSDIQTSVATSTGNFCKGPQAATVTFKGIALNPAILSELQTLSQKLQQLRGSPQTQQTLEVQERIRILRTQIQQEHLKKQQQQQQGSSQPLQMQNQPQSQQQQTFIIQMQPQQQQQQQQNSSHGILSKQQQQVVITSQPLTGGTLRIQQPMTQQGQVTPGQQMAQIRLANTGNKSAGKKIIIIQQQPPTGKPAQHQTIMTSAVSKQVPLAGVSTPISLPQTSTSSATTAGVTLVTSSASASIFSNSLSTASTPKAQHILIQTTSQSGSTLKQVILQPVLAQNATSVTTTSTLPQKIPVPALQMTVSGGSAENSGNSEEKKTSEQQEKANKIIAEAIAKAQKAGKAIPRVVSPSSAIPAVVSEDMENQEETAEDGKGKTKRKKGCTPKRDRKKKEKAEEDEEKTEKKEKKPKTQKEKRPKIEKAKPAKKKKRPPATFLKNKKRKRRGSSDESEVEMKITPPPSPENEEDGIQKRRSGRVTKRKKYLDDVDLNLSDDESQDVDVVGTDAGGTVENPVEEDAIVVEKILGMRIRKRDADEEVPMDEEPDVEEFYVKYKNFSYLHCEWKTAKELEKDKRIHMKIKRFKMKRLQANNYFTEMDEDELFNPDYVEVERVLEVSVTEDPSTGETVTHFLVKWRGLPYEDSTWELQQDVDPEKVKLFFKYNELPPEEEREYVPRPKGSGWTQLEDSPDYKGGNVLREYQLEGLNWLIFSWYKGQNCILADEMGLGKTIQSISFLKEMHKFGIKGPFLVVVPLSTVGNWQREFETWTDLNVIIYHGSASSRFMLQEYEMYFRDEDRQKILDIYKFNVLVTTYEIIISDVELLSQIEWRCIIIDEAHRLKNKNCRLLEGLRMFDFEHKVLLSGTPLQNNVEELFSLLNFLEPEQFNSSDAFQAEFGNLRTEEQVEKLKSILKPMMLRRLKEDVEKNLAPKEETIIEVELTNIQKKYYRAILERNFSFLSKGTTTTNIPNLMNTMMELRKCCNHPYLIKGAEETILLEVKEKQGASIEQMHRAMVTASGKLVLLDKLLPKLKQGGHKVLIFSQMIRVLDILEDYLLHKRYLYERLDGRIRGNLRQEAIDRFCKPDSDRFVFLLCTRAGGLGINLTAADTVIIYDSDWNPQNDLQAQARCHRIGQDKAVKVYRLITRNTYEREMFDRASLKLGLDKAVLQSMGADKQVNQQAQLSKKDVEELLKKGAYGALMDDDRAGDQFCEEDIDQILQRRTQVIQIESEGKGSTFAKASFTMSGNRSDIDINDPEFWQKWARKADINTSDNKRNELIVEEPRVRKQTARYGNNDNIVDMSELESSSNSDDEEDSGGRKKEKGGRRGRSRRGRRGDMDEDFQGDDMCGNGYGRSELFKVEKHLLVYGWGRWEDILAHARFKRKMTVADVEKIARAMMIYSLQFYKGDDRIKEFIWDLVSPKNDGTLKNHLGLSAPVPRGRKGKKAKKETRSFNAAEELEKAGFDFDPEAILKDKGYRRHIQRHSNKVLLRVRLLYYLKQEVIGDQASKVMAGVNISEIDLPPPIADGEPPTQWWDELADKSLLVGVFKHGYEKYNLIRQDPQFVFLTCCGPPDGAALLAEENDDDDNFNDDLDEKMGTSMMKDDENDDEDTMSSMPESSARKETENSNLASSTTEGDKLPFPSVSDLNSRLRKIITGYQRDYKRQQQKMAQSAKRMEKREKLEAVFRERESKRRESLHRWTRREEADFYRVVSTYGIEFSRMKGQYSWDRFRILARLDKKTDETLTEYFMSFYHMCLRVCRRIKENAYPPTPIYVEPITEERANRCIARIDLLNKIREEILLHPKLDERLKLCQTSYDLPSYWICGKHDKELLLGAAKYGLARTDYFIFNDPDFSFKEVAKTVPLENASPFHFGLFGSGKEKLENERNAEEDVELPESVDDKTSIKQEFIRRENSDDDTSGDMNRAKGGRVKEEMKMEVEDGGVKRKKTENLSDKKQDSENSYKRDVKVEDVIKKEIEDEKMNLDSANEGEVNAFKTEEVKIKESSLGRSEVKTEVDAKKIWTEGVEEQNIADVGASCKQEGEKHSFKAELEEESTKAMGTSCDDLEDTNAEGYSNVMHDMMSQWPKDRVIFHRLEHICYCVETGEWPFPKKMPTLATGDSRSVTPSNSTPRQDDLSQSDAGDSQLEQKKELEKDFEVQMSEGDGLKLTFHKKGGRKRQYDMEPEKAARIQQILNQNLASAASSDNESRSESSFNLSASQTPERYTNGSPITDPEALLQQHSLLEQGLLFPQRRRGRKRKAEKLAEIAMAEALARRQQARALAFFDPDARVPVINLEDGSRLSGDDAPLKKDLDKWLDDHPGYMVDSRVVEDDIEEGEIIYDTPEKRRGRRPRLDPTLLDADKLTGDENVSVVNRLTGKKITGAKAPPLRYLTEWLEQNPTWDVDQKWADLVKAKGNLPKNLLQRVVTPTRRGRGRPRESFPSHSIFAGDQLTAAAAAAASMNALSGFPGAGILTDFSKLPLNMPFGALGLGSPLFGLPGFGLSGLPVSSSVSKLDSDSKGIDSITSRKGESKSSSSTPSSSTSTTTPHPSFPLLYNPLYYNSLFATQGLTSAGHFQLTGSHPSAFASLAQGSFLNGKIQSDSEKDLKLKKSGSNKKEDKAQDLSFKEAFDLSLAQKDKHIKEAHSHSILSSHQKCHSSSLQDAPTDLSMKPKQNDWETKPIKEKVKSKSKIFSSLKLNKIVDSLKDRVLKMEDKSKSKEKDLEDADQGFKEDWNKDESNSSVDTDSVGKNEDVVKPKVQGTGSDLQSVVANRQTKIVVKSSQGEKDTGKHISVDINDSTAVNEGDDDGDTNNDLETSQESLYESDSLPS
ncbi:hypothetical protein CHS0354_031028 [Potamilus streckersoni]|uniref:Chromodomain-helicase-DNA-binding protein 8 n=1 Tax=Potamilus streckersoni TaxID=2493646 RepID=A0AAE0WC26_9BIVA|nr:hypothetical protein CHS0354_031028 [Potamilus streckersoni]